MQENPTVTERPTECWARLSPKNKTASMNFNQQQLENGITLQHYFSRLIQFILCIFTRSSD